MKRGWRRRQQQQRSSDIKWTDKVVTTVLIVWFFILVQFYFAGFLGSQTHFNFLPNPGHGCS